MPKALEEARRLRDEAETIVAPQVPASLSRAESVAFVSGPMKAWVVKKRAAIERAAAAYAETLERSRGAELATAALELGDLWSSFAIGFMRLGVASMPLDIAAKPDLAKSYAGAIEDAVAPQRENARAAYELCASGEAEIDASTKRCREKLDTLSRIRKPTPAPEAPRHVQPVERPWLPTRQPAPCTFAGSLRLPRAPISLSRESEPFALLEAVEISKLDLPKQRSEPLHVSTSWPVRMSFYMAAERAPFTLRSRIDFVPGHVWLPVGAAVTAALPNKGRALVYRHTSAEPDPAKLLSCAELGLSGETPLPNVKPANAKEFVGHIALHAAADGRKLGQFSLESPQPFDVLEERGAWMRVSVRQSHERASWQAVPYEFDAWTNARPTREMGFGMIGLLMSGTRATHVLIKDVELFSAADSGSSVGTLVKGVPVLVGDTQNGFVNVDVPGLIRAGEAWGFWVKAGDFEMSSRRS